MDILEKAKLVWECMSEKFTEPWAQIMDIHLT